MFRGEANYDDESLLTGAGALTMSRDSGNGLLDTTTLGDMSDDRDYSLFGELSAYSATDAGAQQVLFQVAYDHDKLGRITKKTQTIEGVGPIETHYKYDLAGRLWRVCPDDACTTIQSEYLYDPNGNRIAGSFTAHDGAVLTATHDDQDRLTSYETTLGGTATFTYGPNGELETKTVGSDVTRYSYDAFGNLRSVVLHEGQPNEKLIEYLVDGRNRRIGKKVDGVLVQQFAYDGQLRPVAEFSGTGSLIAQYVYAEKENVPAYILKGLDTYRIISDHLGSPRLVVNVSDGSIAQRADYDEFGNVLLDDNPGFQPFGFAGGIYDSDAGLIRFGARDYDPQTARWTAKDPILFAGKDTNVFGYVANNPVNFADPSGTIAPALAGLIAVAAETVWGYVCYRISVAEAQRLGDTDKAQHCIASCRFTRCMAYIQPSTTIMGGILHEIRNPNYGFEDAIGDIRANIHGIEQAYRGGECSALCRGCN